MWNYYICNIDSKRLGYACVHTGPIQLSYRSLHFFAFMNVLLPVVGSEGDLEGVELLLVLVNVDHEPTPIAIEVDVIVEVVVTIEPEMECLVKD